MMLLCSWFSHLRTLFLAFPNSRRPFRRFLWVGSRQEIWNIRKTDLKLCYFINLLLPTTLFLSSYENCTLVHNCKRITCHSESFVDSSAILRPEINVDEIHSIYCRHHQISLNPSPSPEMGYFGSIISSSMLVGIRHDVTLLVKPIYIQLKPSNSNPRLLELSRTFLGFYSTFQSLLLG